MFILTSITMTIQLTLQKSIRELLFKSISSNCNGTGVALGRQDQSSLRYNTWWNPKVILLFYKIQALQLEKKKSQNLDGYGDYYVD